MLEKIRKIARGHIDSELPVVSIEPSAFEETVSYGDISKSEFHINCENRIFVRGFIYSSNPKVTLNATEFSGVFNHISFNVDASRLDNGEVIEGHFSIVSNAGEYVLPYSFTVVSSTVEGNKLTTIDEFYSLYKNNFEKAQELFFSPEFIYMPFMLDPGVRAIYDGLIKSSDKSKIINEFLIAQGLESRPIITSSEEEVSVFEASRPPASSQSTVIKRALRYEMDFDHAKISFETGKTFRNTALQEMRKAYDALLNIGVPIKNLDLHNAEISFYDRYREGDIQEVNRYSALRSLRRCYERGCRSPYLYLEVCKAFRELPDTIIGFDELTIQALNFGSKYSFLSNEIADIVGRHASIARDIEPLLLVAMKRMYRDYPSSELLEGIIATLIKSNDKSKTAFTWYLKGINEGVSISKLYDYLIGSLPEDYINELPREVYLYYSYNEPSTEQSKKTFYYNVISNFDSASSVYKSLESGMRKFVTDEVYVGNIDEKLAALYSKFLHIEMVDERTAKYLPDLIMTHCVESTNNAYKNLIVIYEELEGEQVVPFDFGKALLPIYTDNYHFLAEDKDGVRYFDDELVPVKLIQGKDNLFYTCARWSPSMPSYRIKEANRLIAIGSLSSEELQELRNLAVSSGIHPLFKSKINNAIITHYNWTNEDPNANAILECETDKYLSDSERAILATTFIKTGLYNEAVSLIRKIGYNKIDINELSKVVSRYISQNNYEYEASILEQAFYIFNKGFAGNYILEYLCRYYNGLSADMFEILKKSIAEMVPLGDITDRLLSQMMFSNSYEHIDDVFKCYAEHSSVDKNVLNAYYVIKCTNYFINNEDIDSEIFDAAKKVMIDQLIYGNAPVIIQLAVTKYFSEINDLSEEDKNLCRTIVSALVQKGIVFPHFKRLSELVYIPEEIQDKTIFSFVAHEGDSVTLILVPEDDDVEPVYLEMNYVCSGIFVRSVLLFEGEHQSYQVRVNHAGETYIALEGELKPDILYSNEKRSFVRLNKLLEGSDNPQDDKWLEDMTDYAFDNALVKMLFDIE